MESNAVVSLILVLGESRHRCFSLNTECRRALFRIGSGAECNWRVHGIGIAHHHLMLLWKAGELTVINVGADDLFVDGQPVARSLVVASAHITFGSAAIVVERGPK
ncbi:MAG: hypothetical protein GY811_09315 [Myxococcales bacterium]|nr:hypothetical protein [Myxococcales bacterium]